MGFSKGLKLQAKRRAHFCCSICHVPGVEIHHIVPQADGDDDTFENAAPLCPSCHETYGANPTKRAFIREARDYWYELCDKRFAPQDQGSLVEILEIVASSNRQLANLRKDLRSSISTSDNSEDVFNLGICGVMQHVLTLHENDSFPGFDLLFADELWGPEGMLETRDWLYQEFGKFFLEKLCLHSMFESRADIQNSFTEDEFADVFRNLVTYSVLLEHLLRNELVARINENGEFQWRVTDVAQQIAAGDI